MWSAPVQNFDYEKPHCVTQWDMDIFWSILILLSPISRSICQMSCHDDNLKIMTQRSLPVRDVRRESEIGREIESERE